MLSRLSLQAFLSHFSLFIKTTPSPPAPLPPPPTPPTWPFYFLAVSGSFDDSRQPDLDGPQDPILRELPSLGLSEPRDQVAKATVRSLQAEPVETEQRNSPVSVPSPQGTYWPLNWGWGRGGDTVLAAWAWDERGETQNRAAEMKIGGPWGRKRLRNHLLSSAPRRAPVQEAVLFHKTACPHST